MLSTSGEYVGTGYTIYNTTFGYDNENRPTTLNYGGSRQTTVTYDALGRVSKRTVNAGSAAVTSSYSFIGGGHGTGSTSGLVQTITQPTGNLTYTYDNNGNILSVNNAGVTTSYTYDLLGQLTRVNDPVENATWVYEYDRGGNLLSKKKYAYTTGTVGTVQQTIAYTYGDSNWKDKLTAYNGVAINYDAIGNPTSDGTWTYTWTNGRQLASVSKSGTTASYTYNEDGLRVQKNVNGTVTNYVLHGKNVVHLTQGSNNLHFFYGADGSPAIVEFNEVSYGYIKNLQGDIIAIVNASGTKVVEYAYDAWGRALSKSGSMASTLGTLNPFRYRGYVYDEETGLYYLRSRYYNPVWDRFINTDTMIQTDHSLLGTNLFAYCFNNPVNALDPFGFVSKSIFDFDNNEDVDSPYDEPGGGGGITTYYVLVPPSVSWSSLNGAPLYDSGVFGLYATEIPWGIAKSAKAPISETRTGVSKAPKISKPNSLYQKYDNCERGLIVSETLYNTNGKPYLRNDYSIGSDPNPHFDRNSGQYLSNHQHEYIYNESGYVIDQVVHPIMVYYVRVKWEEIH